MLHRGIYTEHGNLHTYTKFDPEPDLNTEGNVGDPIKYKWSARRAESI